MKTIDPGRNGRGDVDEPLTEELLQELLSAPDPQAYLGQHRLEQRSLSEYLQQMLVERGLTQSQAVKNAQLNETYGYEIFTGRKQRPSRDRVLAIAFGMRLNLTQANRALQAAQCSQLYCKSCRDAIIIFALEHGYSLHRLNDTLYRYDEEILGGQE